MRVVADAASLVDMAMQLDHIIVAVNDAAESLAFYSDVLGLAPEGEDGPFSVVRVTPDLVLLLAPFGTDGNMHFAFSLTPDEFGAALARLRETGVPHGDSYHDATNGRGPGNEFGAKGFGPTLYLLDPNRHLIELRCYE